MFKSVGNFQARKPSKRRLTVLGIAKKAHKHYLPILYNVSVNNKVHINRRRSILPPDHVHKNKEQTNLELHKSKDTISLRYTSW